MRIFVLALFTVLTLVSCSVESRVQVLVSGEAKVSTRIVLLPAFAAYWNDLRGADPTLPSSLIDASVWKKALALQSEASPPRLTAPTVKSGTSEVNLSFGVPDLNAILGSQMLGRLSVADGRTQLVLTLDRKSLRSLLALTTVGNSPAVSGLIPAEKARVTAADYTQLLTYLLEPYDAAAATLIGQSTVELRLELPSAPVQVEGALSVTGNTIVARWPLTRVLSLETPITLRAVY